MEGQTQEEVKAAATTTTTTFEHISDSLLIHINHRQQQQLADSSPDDIFPPPALTSCIATARPLQEKTLYNDSSCAVSLLLANVLARAKARPVVRPAASRSLTSLSEPSVNAVARIQK